MDKKLSQLLEELYQIDPSLKSHDSLLRSVLGEVLASRPEATMDPAFYRDLRETLLSRLSETEAVPEAGFTTPRFSPFSNFQFPRLAYAFSGLTAVLGIAVLANGFVPSNGVRITSVEPSAFGSLSTQSDLGEMGGLGGGGAVDSMIIYPEERINTHFNYTGDALASMDVVEVLKRVAMDNPLSVKLDVDTIDVDQLGPMKVAYTTLQPLGEEGYSLSYDPNAQTLSLNAYHSYSEDCPWGYCNSWASTPLTEADVPSDEALIAVSDAFFEEFGLDQDLVGAPYVNDYAFGPEMEISSWLTVTYPFEIDGMPVYMSWGGRAGLTVDIDVSRMKVLNVNWIYTSEDFEASSYEAASTETVLELAANGGVSTSLWEDPTKVIELDLGTPTLVYAQIQNYSSTGTYSDLYAPAYAFPILNDTEDLYYGDSIVVPLAEELAHSAPPMILY